MRNDQKEETILVQWHPMTRTRYVSRILVYLLFIVGLTPTMLSGCGDTESQDFVRISTNQTAAANTTIQLTGVVPRVLARNAQVPATAARFKLTICDGSGQELPVPTVRVLVNLQFLREIANGEGIVDAAILNGNTVSLKFNRPLLASQVKVTYLDSQGQVVGRAAAPVAIGRGNVQVENPPLVEVPGDILTFESVPSPINVESRGFLQIRVNGFFSAPANPSVNDITSLAQFQVADTSVVTVSPTGLIVAGFGGTTTLTIFVDGRSIEVPVTVGTRSCQVDQLVAGPRTQVVGNGFTFQHVRDCDEAFTFGAFRVTNNRDVAVNVNVTHTAPLASIELANDADMVFAINASTGLAAGESAIFRVRYTDTQTGSFNATVRVTCDALEGAPFVDIPISAQISPPFTVGQTAITHTHDFGVSSCPDPIGAFPFTNNCDQQVMVTLDPGRVFSPTAPIAVAAGATVQIPISFDCGTANSFSELVGVQVTGPTGTSAADGPTVTVNVSSPPAPPDISGDFDVREGFSGTAQTSLDLIQSPTSTLDIAGYRITRADNPGANFDGVLGCGSLIHLDNTSASPDAPFESETSVNGECTYQNASPLNRDVLIFLDIGGPSFGGTLGEIIVQALDPNGDVIGRITVSLL